jgi:hypothetical protein
MHPLRALLHNKDWFPVSEEPPSDTDLLRTRRKKKRPPCMVSLLTLLLSLLLTEIAFQKEKSESDFQRAFNPQRPRCNPV